MNATKLESALRALYQSGLGIRTVISSARHFGFKDSEVALWEQAMQAAKEALEPDPKGVHHDEGKASTSSIQLRRDAVFSPLD